MMMLIKTVVYILIACSLFEVIYGACDPITGPAGDNNCIKLPNHTGYQWGTCLSNTTIKLLSRGTHYCSNKTNPYCLYQCMLGRFGISNGKILKDCVCSLGEAVQNTLPNWCYSPSGRTCSWYKECLEKQYPCKNNSDPYTLSIGDYFCQMNAVHDINSQLTVKGRRWSDAVGKCLQVSMVSEIRPYIQPSCSDIKTKALNKHGICYRQPYLGAPTVCDISLSDFSRTFCTIKSAHVTSSFDLSLWGLLSSFSSCPAPWKISFPGFHTLMIVIKLTKRTRRRRTMFHLETSNHLIASMFFDKFAAKIDVNKNPVDWFVFAGGITNTNSGMIMHVGVYLMDKTVCDMSYNGPATEVDLNKYVMAIGGNIQKGVRVDVGEYQADSEGMRACLDVACKTTYASFTSSDIRLKTHVALVIAALIWVSFMG